MFYTIDRCILLHTWYPNELPKLIEHNMRRLTRETSVHSETDFNDTNQLLIIDLNYIIVP